MDDNIGIIRFEYTGIIQANIDFTHIILADRFFEDIECDVEIIACQLSIIMVNRYNNKEAIIFKNGQGRIRIRNRRFSIKRTYNLNITLR